MKFREDGSSFDLLGYAVAGSHDVESIDESAAASARSDSYVRLKKVEVVFSLFKKKRKKGCARKSIDENLTCHGKLPNPASSPPTILLCAVCFEAGIPHPVI